MDVDAVRGANDIVDVIGGYLNLRKMGVNWRGVCPFHNDTSPSLVVSKQKQIFKCFACGKGGDVLTFVMEYDKVTFADAVKALANRAGIKIDVYEKKDEKKSEKSILKSIYAEALSMYTESITKEVREYMESRHIDVSAAKDMNIGYAPQNNRALLERLLKTGASVENLKKSGLFKENGGAMTDLLAGRLIFPIHSASGECVAFGGRSLADAQNPKYVNSPTTIIYEKGTELYGLHKTKYNISKADYSIVCEGYMDFLRMYVLGVNNCVASLGTSITEEQLRVLKRYSNRVVFMYDGDVAGRKAAVRGALMCLSMGIEAKIVILPAEEDPDTYFHKNGVSGVSHMVETAPSIIQYYATHSMNANKTSEVIGVLMDNIKKLDNPIMKELMVRDIANAFGISEQSVMSTMGTQNRETKRKPIVRTESNMEDELLAAALRDGDTFNAFIHDPNAYGCVKGMLNRKAAKQIMEVVASGEEWDIKRIMSWITGDDVQEHVAGLLLMDPPEYIDILTEIMVKRNMAEIAQIDAKILSDHNNVELYIERDKIVRAIEDMGGHITPELK